MNTLIPSLQKRYSCRDRSLPNTGTEKTQRVMLGLDVLRATARPGIRYTQLEIAAFAGCTTSAIYLIEQKALRKLRNRLLFTTDPALVALREAIR